MFQTPNERKSMGLNVAECGCCRGRRALPSICPNFDSAMARGRVRRYLMSSGIRAAMNFE
jgi:hypothetical protein